MENLSQQKIYYTLRIASAMCFIGHGAFGIITKQIWCNYFEVFDIGKNAAFTLMPVLGTIDILMGIIILLYPLRAVVAWLVIWGMITAMLRPLSGEPFAEFIERAGNYGAPLSLLIITGSYDTKIKNWLSPVRLNGSINLETLSALLINLRIVVCLLFIGHGSLNLIGKKSLLDQYAALGFADATKISHIAGTLEIAAAIAVLIKPSRPLLLLLFMWKALSELMYPHYELFEWIERGGSYCCVLALYFAVDQELIFKKRLFGNSYCANEKLQSQRASNPISNRFNIN